MAVIISDMEHIPNGCFDCDLHNYHFCNLTGNLVENNLDDGTRADDCPLKEVNDKPSGKWIPIEQIITDSINEAKNTVLEDIKNEIPNLVRYESADGQDLIMAHDMAMLIDEYISGK